LVTFDITQTSVIANWDPVPGAVSYRLQTRRVPNGPWIDTNPAIFSSTSILIWGFDPCSWYEWRVRANCSNGFSSNWEDGIPFITECGNCEPPFDLYVTDITQNTCTLNWSSVPDAINYTIQFLDYNTGTWYNLGGPPVAGTSLSIYGLWANFGYTWRVVANCSNNTSSNPSEENTFYAGYAPSCALGNLWPFDALNPTASWKYVDLMWGGDYSLVNVTGGTTYTFSFCTTHGAQLDFDGEIYLRSTDGTVIAHNDDNCGLSPKLVWRAGFTGQVEVLLAKWTCETETSFSKMAYKTGAAFNDPSSESRSDESRETRVYQLTPTPPMAQNFAPATDTESADLHFKIFPNPSSGEFNVQFETGSDEDNLQVTVQVYNVLGHIMWEKSTSVDRGVNTWEIKAESWPSGIYGVYLMNGNGTQTMKKIYLGK
jgi:hypothetical protein